LSLSRPPPIPAQAIRIALHDLGVPYEEEYAARDVWPAMKKDRTEAGVLTFGQIPQWTAPDGVTTMVQSGAILRHLARAHGAYGSSEADMARVDVVMDGAADWRRAYTKLIYTDRLEAAAVAEYKAGPLPTWLGFFERLAAAGGSAGFIAVPAACTIADYALFDLIDTQRRVFPDLLDGGATPALAAWHRRLLRVGPGAPQDRQRQRAGVNAGGGACRGSVVATFGVRGATRPGRGGGRRGRAFAPGNGGGGGGGAHRGVKERARGAHSAPRPPPCAARGPAAPIKACLSICTIPAHPASPGLQPPPTPHPIAAGAGWALAPCVFTWAATWRRTRGPC
jgi:glutathione S-transferase